MFQKGKTYTHKSMLDCVIRVLAPAYLTTKGQSVKVDWFLKNGMRLGITETIQIKNEHLNNWYEWR